MLEDIVKDKTPDKVVIEVNRLVQNPFLPNKFLAQMSLIVIEIVELLGLAL